MSTLPDTRQLAYVHYHCLCSDVYNKSTSSTNTTTNPIIVANATDEPITEKTKIPKIPPFDVNSPRVNFSTFPISKLYFCDFCHQIRCPRCVQEEIVCYYCPNCLFEVPTASVKSERNRCARNCFQCPICQNTLSVTASAEAQSTASGAPFYLTCGVCRWDSQEIEMTFEKATGLALQLQKTEDEKPDVKEFDHLKEHFEKHLRQNTPSTSLPSSLLIPGMGISSRYGGGGGGASGNHQINQQKTDDLTEYVAITKVENDTGLIEDLAQLKVINQITTLTQRMNQLSDQPYKVERLQPQRIHLRTKRIKRCRSCRHILIKPEQKAQATRFKIKLVALASIPKITIASLPKLFLNQKTQIVLKFSNPSDEEIYVELALKADVDDNNNNNDVDNNNDVNDDNNNDNNKDNNNNNNNNPSGKVEILAPNFYISPYNDIWEYEEPELVSAKSRSHSTSSSSGANAKNDIGIYERRGNYTSIIVEITPLSEVEEFKFPLLVTYTTKSTENNENNEATAQNTTSSPVNTSPQNGEKTDTTTNNDDNNNTKSLSFWTVIGLGYVVNQNAVKAASSRSSISISHIHNASNVRPAGGKP